MAEAMTDCQAEPPQNPPLSYVRVAPGESAVPGQFRRGDFILTHGSSFFSRLIRFGQGLRFLGRNRKYTHWSHAALIVSEDGALIEARGAGVRRAHISDYQPTEYHLVSIDKIADERDRAQVIAFAERCVGRKYGLTTVFSIAAGLLTGVKFTFGFDGEYICSGLVARALERTDAILPRSPSHTSPADLAKYFSVTPPKGRKDKGRPPGKKSKTLTGFTGFTG